MIRATNLKNDQTPYLTEITNGKEGMKPILTDSSVQPDAEDMTPSELFQASLAGCVCMTLSGVLRKRGIPFDDVEVDVKMEQRDGKTVLTRSVKVISDAPAEQISAAVERAKNSFMSKLLTGEIEIVDE